MQNQTAFPRPLFIAGITLALLAACGGKQQAPQSGPPEVSVVTLKAQSVPLTTELPGRTTAYRVAEVRPQVSGVLLKRTFKEGGEVKAGQPLYQIDPAPYKAAYDSAAAALKKAQASATSAQLLADRYTSLVKTNAVSKQDYDNAVASNDQAQADVASAKAALETARINLTYTKVLAPISGRIGRSSVTEGALVTAQQTTALATIQQLDPIYVDVTQPSSTLLKLRRELAAGTLKGNGEDEADVHLKFDDGSDYEHQGKLQFAEVEVDPTTSSVTMRAEFPNPDGLLLPGLFVREQLQEATDPNAILVPQRAVTRDPTGDATALVAGADGKVEQRTVKVTRSIGNQWLVSDGLKAGDRVIFTGLQQIKPGMQVKPVEGDPNQADGGAAAAASGGGQAGGKSAQPTAQQ
ncbi:efflux RND transporter periplasmic adaptor subunit [Solimonas marina]|uniref:Efflux RND transporter periplasmic adaptor subunit n=1 Tax=Solimonas marina TaxID=2714601 RepID=A0A969W591_9GAMM|nr:efflux RND transporter periplasmic adaptor subunit [Solimonas marina]NKF20822.1 efflux RND transporter periplasmic adaptor subunit [Solimonas marina]